jgi:hypothetical protein
MLSKAKSVLKRMVTLAVIEMYWALDAQDEDNMAKQVILKMAVKRDTPDDIVVAEVDDYVRAKGKSARRILREQMHGKS